MKRSTFLWLALAALPAAAQVATGIQPFATLQPGAIDSVDLGSLNVHINIPIISFTGRGQPFDYILAYDSTLWTPSTTAGWQPAPNWGWSAETEGAIGYVTYNQTTVDCYGHLYSYRNGFIYYDNFGAGHGFGGVSWNNNPCGMSLGNWSAPASDNSGYSIQLSSSSTTASITSAGGVVAAVSLGTGAGAGTVTDANGNEITTTGSSFIDTLGNTALTISGSGTPWSPRVYSWNNPQGGTSSVTVYYADYYVQTNFGCPGVPEYSGSALVPLPVWIVMPNGTDIWKVAYESTPGYPGYITGRIASIQSPAGGTISYAYSAIPDRQAITCADGSAAVLARTTPDSPTPWTYAHVAYSSPVYSTSVIDPSGNYSLYWFYGLNVLGSTGTLYSYFPGSSQIYSGNSTTGTLLAESGTSYNGSGVYMPTFPVSQAAVTSIVPNGVSGGLQSKTVTDFNGDGLPTEVDEYDWGSAAPGALLRKTVTSYASLSGVVGMPAQVSVYNGSGGLESQTTWTYTNTATSTSGVAQHTSAPGDRPNVAGILYMTAGASTLSRSFTWYDTGNVATATDVNGAVTTYGYGSGSCGQSFADTIGEPLSLSRSQSWNCTGEVQTGATDENGNTSGIGGWDTDYWRPTSVNDAAGNTTTLGYPAYGQVRTELDYNGGASTTTTLTTADSQGRPWLSQQREGPSSSTWDTVQTGYDANGRAYARSAPYASSAGTAAGSAFTTTTFDTLNRPLTVTPAGSSSAVVTYAYSQNDVLVNAGGPERQLEYDGIGRLTSVCELTSATGAGACGQNNAQTGYWTTYTNNTAGQITAVTQNAQAPSGHQTRSYSFDGLLRLTSETNPETGTVAYYFDSDSTCGLSSAGDLIRRVDNMGNVTCTAYDAYHRPTDITYPSGPYASVTAPKHYVYDAATVNGAAMANPAGRLARAYTGSSGSPTTDLGFSYTALGQPTDVWQATPNSGGYYHTQESYWPNGTLETLSLPSGSGAAATLLTLNYGVDAMGRVNSVTNSSYTSPVPASSPATFNTASQVTSVGYGSGDSDSFSYNAATGLMTNYTYNVGAQYDSGTLSWNADGSLANLSIADPLVGTDDGESCSYSEDNLRRVAAMNCAKSGWNQSFNYDIFGNLMTGASGTGSGFSTSFNADNQLVIGTGWPAYDSNGNILDEPVYGVSGVYGWDAEGRPLYTWWNDVATDALGRVVEAVDRGGGGSSQPLYAPDGTNLGYMTGSSWDVYEIPLPGGSLALYDGYLGASTPRYYAHPDWQGTKRLWSTWAQTWNREADYSPYGVEFDNAYGYETTDFTGQRQFIGGGILDFPLREYNPTEGRWLSPDPLGLGAVDPTDPQTWNRYAYVRGNPLELTDPTGLKCVAVGPYSWRCDVNGNPPPPVSPPGCVGPCGRGFHNPTGGGGGGGSDGGGGSGTGGPSTPIGPTLPKPVCTLAPPTGNFRLAPPPATDPYPVVALFNPATASALAMALLHLNGTGIVPTMNSGLRTAAEQAILFKQGKGAAVSLHEIGAAVDFGLNSNAGANTQILQAMVAQGFTAGATFSSPDPGHFQIGGPPVSLQMLSACGGG